eukprot:CAMPEP_0118953604 /NCGR_PEP_ID=MMETSP1169-20130426/56869_1 /TAXON_ID=36882 /ORGANISM="Pyramimonas obovata, Strain CCMP722" /LENGTH=112 /DNA_ID=CAMNT_0006901107 /DNA_START=219 /DNA_END=553 /DNA_ORIENTATION=-
MTTMPSDTQPYFNGVGSLSTASCTNSANTGGLLHMQSRKWMLSGERRLKLELGKYTSNAGLTVACGSEGPPSTGCPPRAVPPHTRGQIRAAACPEERLTVDAVGRPRIRRRP